MLKFSVQQYDSREAAKQCALEIDDRVSPLSPLGDHGRYPASLFGSVILGMSTR
jgi:hypothetical protein